MLTGLTGAGTSVKPGQLSLHLFVQLVAATWRLDGGLDMRLDGGFVIVSRWWIGHGVSTVNLICQVISIIYRT